MERSCISCMLSVVELEIDFLIFQHKDDTELVDVIVKPVFMM